MRMLRNTLVIVSSMILATPVFATEYGRVEGVFQVTGVEPGGQRVFLRLERPDDPESALDEALFATTGDDGRFVFEEVPAGEARIGWMDDFEMRVPGEWSSYFGTFTHDKRHLIQPGETLEITIGGSGSRVKGRLALPEDARIGAAWRGTSTRRVWRIVERERPPEGLGREEAAAWYEAHSKTEAARQERMQQRLYQLQLEDDGRFQVQDVEPGEYALYVEFTEAGSEHGTPAAGRVQHTFTVPGDGRTVDLGELPAETFTLFEPGDTAPHLQARTLSKEWFTLEDYKSKYVLLDFWATWCGPCVAETPNLKAVWDEYGEHEDFAMLALSLDSDIAPVKDYVEQNGIQWDQGWLGEWSQTDMPDQYGVRGIPAIMLIGPDGKLIARNLRGEAIGKAIGEALEGK